MAEELVRLARRIAAIEDREAIADLVHDYASHVRNGEPESCVALFAPDAVIELRHADPTVPGRNTLHSTFTGHAEIRASFGDTAGQSARIWPMIHNLRIELDGDAARSNCVMMSAIWPHGKEYVGEYFDTYCRRDGAWCFASRSFVTFGDTTGRYSADAYADYTAARDALEQG